MARPQIGIGTAQLGMPYGVARGNGALDGAEAERILAQAVELGVGWVDTAPDYGRAEVLVGRFLRGEGRGTKLEVCTKLPRLPDGLSADQLDGAVRQAVEGSRRRLGVETIDAYLVHAPIDLRTYGAALVDALARCREADRIRQIGISVYEPDDARLALRHPELSATQFPFNVLDHRMRASGMVAALQRAGHRTFARSVLLQGLLAMAPDAVLPHVAGVAPWLTTFRDVVRRSGMDALGCALAYAAAESGANVVILGVDSGDQLRAACDALRRPIPRLLADEMERRFERVPLDVIDPRRWSRSVS